MYLSIQYKGRNSAKLMINQNNNFNPTDSFNSYSVS